MGEPIDGLIDDSILGRWREEMMVLSCKKEVP